ncbi:MAG: PEGA domain-containing protein [Deltaproteobacteria bacterium]|nr:PEGA domain-containing protein [Deltaproteobacteria bacterium]
MPFRLTRSLTLACVFSACAASNALVVHAQTNEQREQAKQLATDGGKLLSQGKLEQAVEAFRKAYSVFPNARYQYNIGVALKNLGKDAEALVAFDLFLKDAQNVPPEFLADARKQRDDLAAHVAKIEVNCSEYDAAVLIDGKPVATTPLVNGVYVDAGQHTLRIEKDGFTAFERRLQLKEGTEERLEVTLQARSSAVVQPVAASAKPSEAASVTAVAAPVESSDPGAIELAVSAGLNLWLAGAPDGAGPAAGFALSGGYRLWSRDDLQFSLGGEAQVTFMSENDNRITFTSLLATPTLKYYVVPNQVALFGRVGLGMMIVSGLQAQSALLTPGAVEVTGALSAFEARPAVGAQYNLSNSTALFASLGLAYSPSPDAQFAESSFVRFTATTGAAVNF